MPDMITINLLHVWLAAKLLTAIGLLRWENKRMPTRPYHHKARRFLYHAFLNPELGLLKLACFSPIWLFTGTKYIRHFLPIETPEPEYRCRVCKDTGLVFHRHQTSVCSCRTTYWQSLLERSKK